LKETADVTFTVKLQKLFLSLPVDGETSMPTSYFLCPVGWCMLHWNCRFEAADAAALQFDDNG